jgi:trk system potassium uptake protein TrkA
LTLPEDSPQIGTRVGDVPWPADTALLAIIRQSRVLVPTKDDPLEALDELLFVASPEQEGRLEDLLSPHHHHNGG